MLHQIIEKQLTEAPFIVSIVPNVLSWLYKIMNFFKIFLQRFLV